jgi:hypothetical protein
MLLIITDTYGGALSSYMSIINIAHPTQVSTEPGIVFQIHPCSPKTQDKKRQLQVQ